MQDAKQAIRLYQQRRISKDEALLIYKIWIDAKGTFHPIYFMSANTTIRFLNELIPQFINNHVAFFWDDIFFFLYISVERIHNPDARRIIEEIQEYYNRHQDQAAEGSYIGEHQATFDDIPFEDAYSFFDGDPSDMEEHFGDDWESNL